MTLDQIKEAKNKVKSDKFQWVVGMRIVSGLLSTRLNEQSLDDISTGENPWYPWKISEPVLPDLSDRKTREIIAKMGL